MEATQMINIVFGVLFSLFTAVAVLTTIKLNDNPNNFNIRGRRVDICTGVIGGFFLYQFAIHFFWTCDANECKVEWI
jgi:uncharacterized membrane protein